MVITLIFVCLAIMSKYNTKTIVKVADSHCLMYMQYKTLNMKVDFLVDSGLYFFDQ